jgi:hypothetical protein
MQTDYGMIIAALAFLVLIIAIYVGLIRWVFRINHIIHYLEKINDRLGNIQHEKV